MACWSNEVARCAETLEDLIGTSLLKYLSRELRTLEGIAHYRLWKRKGAAQPASFHRGYPLSTTCQTVLTIENIMTQ